MSLGSNPINLGVRFLLELAALAAVGVWGWKQGDGLLRWVLALVLPLIIAVLWGTFRVPGDPGTAPVAIPGALRLLLEAAVFGFAGWCLLNAGYRTAGLVFIAVVVVHYFTSFDRIAWLFQQ